METYGPQGWPYYRTQAQIAPQNTAPKIASQLILWAMGMGISTMLKRCLVLSRFTTVVTHFHTLLSLGAFPSNLQYRITRSSQFSGNNYLTNPCRTDSQLTTAYMVTRKYQETLTNWYQSSELEGSTVCSGVTQEREVTSRQMAAKHHEC